MTSIEEMARYCFGYGRWDAPYWFIGLEEGMSGKLDERIAVWQELGKETGLSDCKKFHERIGVTEHHWPGAEIQTTWRALILMLLTYKTLPNDEDNILKYQQTALGTCDGETLLTELFGLPAKTLKAGAALRGLYLTEKLENDIRFERLNAINEKLLLYKSCLVIMYGLTQKRWFESLVGKGLVAGRRLEKWDAIWRGDVLMTLVPHPAGPAFTVALFSACVLPAVAAICLGVTFVTSHYYGRGVAIAGCSVSIVMGMLLSIVTAVRLFGLRAMVESESRETASPNAEESENY
jgi:hypothetical protein